MPRVARSVCLLLALLAAASTTTAANSLPPGKNWAPPTYRIRAQSLCDQAMRDHPELVSITFHGAPPGTRQVHTMFAGSFPDRIGNIDGVDDLMVINEGVTIVDPRWGRADPVPRIVVSLPLRNAAGDNIGALVLGFRNPTPGPDIEQRYLDASVKLRDHLATRIPGLAALFEPAS